METGRDSALRDALVRLESFLTKHGETFWALSLRKVREGIAHDDKRDKARAELDSFFGGMGSINDLYFDRGEDREEFDGLANSVFRENRLLSAGIFVRLHWRIYSLICGRELSPRIRNGSQ
jgi:hypothetical protein